MKTAILALSRGMRGLRKKTDFRLTGDCCWKESTSSYLQTSISIFLSFLAPSGKIKKQYVCVQHILIRWRCPTIRQMLRWKSTALFSTSPTETTPLAPVFSRVDSLRTCKIWLKENDKTEPARSPLKGLQTSRSKVTEEKTWLAVSTAWSFLRLSHVKIHSLSPWKK